MIQDGKFHILGLVTRLILLLSILFGGQISAYEHCLDLYSERLEQRCILQHQRTQTWIQQDAYYRRLWDGRQTLEYAPAPTVDWVLRDPRARQQVPSD